MPELKAIIADGLLIVEESKGWSATEAWPANWATLGD
jgi:hypothetical protein